MEVVLGGEAYGRLRSLEVQATGEASYMGQGASPEEPARLRRVDQQVTIDFEGQRFYRRDREFWPSGQTAWCAVQIGRADRGLEYDCVSRSTTRVEAGASQRIASWEQLHPLGWVRAARDRAETAERIDGADGTALVQLPFGSSTLSLHVDRERRLRAVDWDVRGELEQEAVRGFEYSDYRQVGGVLFPHVVRYRDSGGRGRALLYRTVAVNQPVPDSIFRDPAHDRPNVASDAKPQTTLALGAGLYLVREIVPGYNAAFIETADGVVVLDAPGGPAGGERLLEIIQERLPGREVAYVVPTHFHHDHVAGLRPFVEAGATVLISAGNAAFLEDFLTGGISGIASARVRPRIEVLEGPKSLGSALTSPRLFLVDASPHVDEMIVAWVPQIRTMYVADLFWRDSTEPLRPADPETDALIRVLRELGLQPERFGRAHGDVGSPQELQQRLALRGNGAAQDSLTIAQREAIDGYVAKVMREQLVPGLSLAVVVDSSSVYEQGYGFADLGSRRPVTPNTVFYTASLGKAFTGMTAAVLAARKQLDLDAPLSSYFPGLRSDPPVRGDDVTVRDLLSHSKGFTNSTINFLTTFVGIVPDTQAVRLLNDYSTAAPGFVYSNTAFALADAVITKATGESWRIAMDRLVFAPLDMSRSTAWASRVNPDETAKPYWAAPWGFEPIAFPKTDSTITGAGGIFSTAHDLAAFITANLNEGRYRGVQALPFEAVVEAHEVHTELKAEFFEFERFAYGLGLYRARWEDDILLHHFGGYPGFRSHVSFIPDKRVGVAVLQNEGLDGSRVADVVATYVYDLLLGRDAETRGAQRLAALRGAVEEQRAARDDSWWTELRDRTANPAAPALPVAEYAGAYRSDRLGTLRIESVGERLRLDWGDLDGVLLPTGGDAFMVDWPWTWFDDTRPSRFVFRREGDHVTILDWGGRLFSKER